MQGILYFAAKAKKIAVGEIATAKLAHRRYVNFSE
jgi:hypothetical protein